MIISKLVAGGIIITVVYAIIRTILLDSKNLDI